MNKKELTCIVCPRGCRLTISKREDEYTVSGNFCKRGIEYGISETKNPVRKVTSTVRIEGGILPRIPVITDHNIPKDKIFDVMKAINKITVKTPVQCGDIIIENVAGTGVNIIASRSME